MACAAQHPVQREYIKMQVLASIGDSSQFVRHAVGSVRPSLFEPVTVHYVTHFSRTLLAFVCPVLLARRSLR
jgi:hypothetical protein